MRYIMIVNGQIPLKVFLSRVEASSTYAKYFATKLLYVLG